MIAALGPATIASTGVLSRSRQTTTAPLLSLTLATNSQRWPRRCASSWRIILLWEKSKWPFSLTSFLNLTCYSVGV